MSLSPSPLTDLDLLRQNMKAHDDVRVNTVKTLDMRLDFISSGASRTGMVSAGDEWIIPGLIMAVKGLGKFELSKIAYLEVCAWAGIPANYVLKTPPRMIGDHVNYWLDHFPKEQLNLFLLSTHPQPTYICGIRKKTFTPFPNEQILDHLLAETKHLGPPKAVRNHTAELQWTTYEIIFPESGFKGPEDRTYVPGFHVKNSLLGSMPLSVTGYLHDMTGYMGFLSYDGYSGNYKRRQKELPDGANEWLSTSMRETIIPQMANDEKHLWEAYSAPVGPAIASLLRQIFSTHKVPMLAREKVINYVEDIEISPSHWDLANMFLRAAAEEYNNFSVNEVYRLEAVAGAILHSLDRCGACNRILD